MKPFLLDTLFLRTAAWLLLFSLTVSQVCADTWEGVPPGYGLAWSDEFNGAVGSQANSANWTYETGANGANAGTGEIENDTTSTANSQIVSDPNAVDGSALAIIMIDATPTSSNYGSTTRYTSAKINSEGKQQYGQPTNAYYEARIHLAGGYTGGTADGIGQAWWMLGANFSTVGWPACGEVDILENGFSDTDEPNMHSTLHFPQGGGNGQASAYTSDLGPSPNDYLSNDYHVYSALILNNQVQFFLDGNLFETQTPSSISGTWEFNQGDFMILGMGAGGGDPNPDSSTSFPATMLVDYARVYQQGMPTPTPVVQSSWYVACGDESNYVSNSTGSPITWVADTNFGFSNGSTAYVPNTVSNTSDSQLYQYSRHNSSATVGAAITYTFNVPTGTTYQVTLKFAEDFYSTSGVREFDYSINGTTEATNFDIYHDAGGEYKADDKVFNNISPNGSGQIILTFTNSAYEAEINAIQIIPMSLVPTPTPTDTPCGYPGNTCTPTPTPTMTSTPTPVPVQVPILYPNPYYGNGSLTLQVPLKAPSDVHVSIFTLAFRKVEDSTFAQEPAGQDSLTINLTDKSAIQLANGLYYIRVVTNQGQNILKLLVLR